MAFRSVFKSAGLASQYRSRLAVTPLIHLKPYSVANKPASETTTPITTLVSDNTPKEENKVEEKVENKDEEKKDSKKPVVEHGYEFGAHHWNLERGAAVGLIPLISTQMIYGAHPIVDGLLGVVLPYHLYLGFESCIIDYIPKRVYPRLHKAAKWTLGGSTGLVMWGCYEFNTNDIGITEFVQRLFAA
ncbi:hypothetical protein G6F56_003832 [Rhizopus delemar]|uniref:Succinate dehydrogenase [ubiquinone] cytochrome b small subunit n=1 Tax=Rhizopus stolonifer TaxID=4846 RepID=A0A367KTH3_RHIST|nr:hypothetical protein G6F56_003832 [Rhizopus delemar]RCI05501.1 membrane anchor subunit of succinate dehydrogenase, Sdh4 [Rhizopus stolonifer]